MLTDMILLIEDDPEEFDIFCQAFSSLDNSLLCIQALNCTDAFQKLDSSKELPKYIFLDLNMPGANGKHCLEQLKKHTIYSSIPVFIYTTSKQKMDVEETKSMGAQVFFTKPNSLEELNKILLFVLSEQWKTI